MTLALLALQQIKAAPNPHTLAFGLALLLAAVAWLIFAIVRRVFKDSRESQTQSMDASPRVENSAAFMTASMQGVIRKLREQEKELERLHRVEKERAEHTERLSEEVTRNMPAGLVMVNAQGIVASANPASPSRAIQANRVPASPMATKVSRSSVLWRNKSPLAPTTGQSAHVSSSGQRSS